jgi:hypothetical protein
MSDGYPMYIPPGSNVISYPPSNWSKSSFADPVQLTVVVVPVPNLVDKVSYEQKYQNSCLHYFEENILL